MPSRNDIVASSIPGVHMQDVRPAPPPGLHTGAPAFLGFAEKGLCDPCALELWPQFEETFGGPVDYLYDAVRGFFENGGALCHVQRLQDNGNIVAALRVGLEKLEPLDAVDLVCAPDIMAEANQTRALELQRMVLDHCERAGDRFAILDAPPGAEVNEVIEHRKALNALNGALYHPWIQLAPNATVPPCGHVAGVYAWTDRRTGVFKAPANEELSGVLDLASRLTDAQHGELNGSGVNCLRALPGRGIRILGARTLADPGRQPAWIYVNVRRLFLTVGRWIERAMAGVVFEPNDWRLWMRIERELGACFSDLFRQGALKGASEEQAYYITCNAETNPPETREAGRVVTEIGLAPAIPNEFVVVRLVHGAGGVTIG